MTTSKRENNAAVLKQLESISGKSLTFGNLLLAIRQSEEVSQAEFGKKLGVSKQYLCDIEKGRRFVSVKAAIDFAHKLCYSERYFIKLCLQDMLDREGIKLVIELQKAA